MRDIIAGTCCRKPCLDVTSQQVGNDTRVCRIADVAAPSAIDGDNAD
jgi:hypothetical protein